MIQIKDLNQLKDSFDVAQAQLASAKEQSLDYNANLSIMGNLPENTILANMYDKISAQYFLQSYNYNNEIVGRYMKASTAYGGIDEIVSFGLAEYREFDYSWDWTKDRFFNQQYKIWASVEYKDQYYTTITTAIAQQAFTSLANYGSAIGQMLQGVMNAKNQKWYTRLRETYLQYPIVIEIEGDPTNNDPTTGFGPKVGATLTDYMNRLTLPSTAYNVAGQLIATPFEEQQLVLNVPYTNLIQWSVARMFRPEVVNNLGKATFTSFIDFEDDTVIGVLDTAQSIYWGLKSSQSGFQTIAANLWTNQYLTEIYTAAIVPFKPTILFRLKGSAPTPKVELDTVVTETNVTITGKDETDYVAELLAAIQAANTNFKPTGKELLLIQRLKWVAGKGKGVATLNATVDSIYIGRVTINFTIDPDGSSNFGR